MPPRPKKHPVAIAESYLAELRARVEAGPGVTAVARAAGVSYQTVWRMLDRDSGRPPNIDGIEHVRLALAKLEPDREPMPPPVVAVRGRDHHGWIALAEELGPDVLAAVAANPALVIAAAKRSRRKK